MNRVFDNNLMLAWIYLYIRNLSRCDSIKVIWSYLFIEPNQNMCMRQPAFMPLHRIHAAARLAKYAVFHNEIH